MGNWIDLMLTAVRRWHGENFTARFFDAIDQDFGPRDMPSMLLVELAYHDYVGFHLQPMGDLSACHRCNQARCEVMDKFDEWFLLTLPPYIPGLGYMNSESVGSILDRVVNHEIKLLHLSSDDLRRCQVEAQRDVLINFAVRFASDCRSGDARFPLYSRFKVDYLPEYER